MATPMNYYSIVIYFGSLKPLLLILSQGLSLSPSTLDSRELSFLRLFLSNSLSFRS